MAARSFANRRWPPQKRRSGEKRRFRSDVNEKHNSETVEKYGSPTKHGLPVMVVLDADGKQLTTKNTEELEEGDHHNPEKVKAFLKEWAPRK